MILIEVEIVLLQVLSWMLYEEVIAYDHHHVYWNWISWYWLNLYYQDYSQQPNGLPWKWMKY